MALHLMHFDNGREPCWQIWLNHTKLQSNSKDQLIDSLGHPQGTQDLPNKSVPDLDHGIVKN